MYDCARSVDIPCQSGSSMRGHREYYRALPVGYTANSAHCAGRGRLQPGQALPQYCEDITMFNIRGKERQRITRKDRG